MKLNKVLRLSITLTIILILTIGLFSIFFYSQIAPNGDVYTGIVSPLRILI